MASTSFIPSQPVVAQSNGNEFFTECGESSSSTEIVSGEDKPDREWGFVSHSTTAEAAAPVVTFDADTISQKPPKSQNPKKLLHSQSSPDFRSWNMMAEQDYNDNEYDDDVHVDVDDEEGSSSAVFVEEEATTGSASLVSEQPSVWSMGSKGKSFKDAILQEPAVGTTNVSKTTNTSQSSTRQNNNNNNNNNNKKTTKPKIVVVEPSSQPKERMRRNSRSMGNLRALDHIQEEDVLGETDAPDFYNRKAQGAIGRKNGQKIRPDEAKRLQITMAKKSVQKQRQKKRG